MAWIIEVNADNQGWRAVRPSGGGRYRFHCEEDATRVMELCYPEECLMQRLGEDPRVRTRELRSSKKSRRTE